jgi:hypothetical protein
MHWVQVYRACWTNSLTARALGDSDVLNFWEDEFRRSYPTSYPTNEELCEVLKHLFEQDRFQRNGPNLNDIRRGVLGYRNRMNEGGRLPSCDICFSGWMFCWPDMPEILSHNEAIRAHDVGLPCTCQSGRLLYDTLPAYKKLGPYESGEMSKMRTKAARQNQAIIASLKTDEPESEREETPF